MDKLRENATQELKEIEKKGLSASNIENAYKLVEIVKGIDKINMMCDEEEYSQARGRYSRDREDYSRDGMSRNSYGREDYGHSMDGYDDGNSYRRGRNQRTGEYMHRPDYSRLSGDDGISRMADAHYNYSRAKEDGMKSKALDHLDDLVNGFVGMMKPIMRDPEYREEKEVIQSGVRKLLEM